MTFFAVRLPEDLQQSIAARLDPWRRRLTGTRWVHPADYHITLRFLGGLNPEALRFLLAEFVNPGTDAPGFSLRLQGAQTFAPRGDRGVLWIGPTQPPAALFELQKQIEQRIQALGFAAERREYRPHMTLGRFSRAESSRVDTLKEELKDEAWGWFSCTEYVLMKRHPGAGDGQGAPAYQVLEKFPLSVVRSTFTDVGFAAKEVERKT